MSAESVASALGIKTPNKKNAGKNGDVFARVVTSAQMRRLEADAAKKLGIPSLLFMENAAAKTVPHIISMLGMRNGGAKNNAVIFCGPGNNGGDGLAVARNLFASGIEATAVCVGEIRYAGDALVNFEIAKKMRIPIYSFYGNETSASPPAGGPPAISLLQAKDFISSSKIVIDAMFGTGLDRPLAGACAETVGLINGFAEATLSLDIPSGVNADTGAVMGRAVKADATVAYGFLKPGLLLYPGAEHAGKIFTENISIPANSPAGGRAIRALKHGEAHRLLPVRPADSHKGSFGRVSVFAGSRDMPGAASLCCAAAYRAGAGLVEAFVTEGAAQSIRANSPETIARVLPEYAGGYCRESLDRVDEKVFTGPGVLLAGPGIGRTGEACDFVAGLVEKSLAPMVLDADALNLIAGDLSVLRGKNVAITPHPGEMDRLTGIKSEKIAADPIGAAADFAEKHGTVVLLKGARSVVASPSGETYINTSGCAALAKAGSGDALAGIVAGLTAQGLDLFEACVLGAFYHGRAGEIAADGLSIYGVVARDVIDALPQAMRL